ncbi:MAG: hypothetical protein JXA46_12265 [Dehalococcoidales bacterium]|nr:hypothetical protein [Dehalococcoidales bacterium]
MASNAGIASESKTIFIDSTYIIHLCYFVRVFIELKEDPNIELTLYPATFEKHGWKKTQLKMDGLEKGKKVFDYLKSNITLGSEVFVSNYTELELLHFLIEGQADNNLLHAGIPYRLRIKKNALLCVYSLDLADYQAVTKEYGEFKDYLRNYGVEYQVFERRSPDYYRQVMEIANIVMANVMLDLPDALIYGAAIAAEADEFLTCDFELRKVVNSLRSSADMKSIAEKFIKELAVQKPSIKAGEKDLLFRLPKGKNV